MSAVTHDPGARRGPCQNLAMTHPMPSLITLAERLGLVSASIARQLIERLRGSRDPQRLAEDLLIAGGHCSARRIARLRLEAAVLTGAPAERPVRIGGYRLIDRLGAGCMGEVYRAEQVSRCRMVALKLLNRDLLRDVALGERFLREAKAAGSVRHPNVVGCYAAGRADGRYFMALELVGGGDAERLMRAHHNRLGERRALAIIRDCASGLEALHAAGFIHRDIKPSNILLSDTGVAKVGDLGLVTRPTSDVRLAQDGLAMGTPAYMSPEQADGDLALDHRTDLYSLGASLYYLLTGKPPFSDKSVWAVVAQVINSPFPDAQRLNPEVSAGCASLLRTATSKDRDKRFQTAQDLRLAAEALLCTSPPRCAADHA
jgi:serine/threonine-protein kinase